MTIRRREAVTILATAAALAGVAGCGQGKPGASPTASAASPGTPTASKPASGASSDTPQAQGTPACSLADLTVRTGSPQGPSGGQRTVSIVFTNTSQAACSLYGYPGVDLMSKNLTWPLQRSGTGLERVVLQPHGEAHSTLTFLAWAPGDSTPFTPAQLEVTPPGAFEHTTLPWTSGGSIVLQNEATRPGTYIGPVSSGG